MKKIHAQTGVEKVEDILDEIREESEIGQELNNALGQQLDPYLCDDDELLAELEGLSSITSSSIQSSPQKLPSMPSVPTNKLPKNKRKDEDDLKLLEAELAGM